MNSKLQARTLFALLALSLASLAPAAKAQTSERLPTVTQAVDDEARRRDMENDPDLYLQLIAGMQTKNLFFASLAHLDAFDKRWPGKPRAALLRGDALRETGYFDKATAIYQSLLNGPQAAAAYHGLGIIAGRKGNSQAALASLERASRLDPTNASILNDLGYIQIINGQWEEARFNLHKATELDSKNTLAGGNLALLYLLENKPDRAAGIMRWYQLPDARRKDIYEQAERLLAPARVEAGAGNQNNSDGGSERPVLTTPQTRE